MNSTVLITGSFLGIGKASKELFADVTYLLVRSGG